MKHANRLWTLLAASAVATAGVAILISRGGREARAAVEPPERVEPVAAAPEPWSAPPAADAEERSEIVAPAAAMRRHRSARAEPMRAEVKLRGAFTGVRGRGEELEVFVVPHYEPLESEYELVEQDSGPVESLAAWSPHSRHRRSTPFDASRESSAQPLDFRVQCRADGSFDRDLTSLISNSRGLPTSFSLSVVHKNFREVTLSVPFAEGRAPVTSSRLAREGTVWLEAYCELEPRCILRGTASCYDGPCPVRLEAWALSGESLASMMDESAVATAEDVFELAVPLNGRYAVVAFADGYLPQTRVIFTWDDLDLWLAPFVLNHGERFSGRVDFSRHTLGGTTSVYLSRENPVLRRDRFGRNGFLWIGNAFEPEMQAAQTDEDGAFEFDGLSPGTWELRIGIGRQSWTEMDPVIYVRVPDEGVLLQPLLAHISLEIEQGRKPVDSRGFELSAVGGSRELVTDRYGRADLWLFPGQPYTLSVAQERGGPWIYGKLAPWRQLEFTERVSMAAMGRR